MFWVRSVYFNERNILPKSGTFLSGHPVCVCVCVCIYIYMYDTLQFLNIFVLPNPPKVLAKNLYWALHERAIAVGPYQLDVTLSSNRTFLML